MRERPLFLYGTLLHEPLLHIVANEPLAPEPASLPSHKVSWAKGGDFPRIDPGEGAVQGILVAPGPARARLDFYEGGFGYDLRDVQVETANGPVQAELYWPGPDVPPADQPFDLTDWIQRWGRMACYAAQEAMESFGQISADTLASRFSMIKTRAWSRVLAEDEPPVPQLPGRPQGAVKTLTHRRPYTEFFSLVEDDLTFPRFDGTQSPRVNRAAMVAADAVVVLPYDPQRDRVLLIEQFRPIMGFRGDPDGFSVEAIAGRIDPGETPEKTAIREAREEAGLELQELHKVSSYYPSTGTLTEYLTCYVATVDLPDGITGVGGLLTEDENIRSHLFEFSEFQDWLDADHFRNGPLILLGHWLVRHHKSLRAMT